MEWQNSKARRIGMSSKKDILKYWILNPDFKYEVCPNECFACGNITLGLHRCHIIPLVLGGGNKEDNLHLLCPPCHSESEALQEYWKWFKYKRENDWDTPVNWVCRRMKSVGIDIDKEALMMKDM